MRGGSREREQVKRTKPHSNSASKNKHKRTRSPKKRRVRTSKQEVVERSRNNEDRPDARDAPDDAACADAAVQRGENEQQPDALGGAVKTGACGDAGGGEAQAAQVDGRVLEDREDGGEGKGEEHDVVVDEEDAGDAGGVEELP